MADGGDEDIDRFLYGDEADAVKQAPQPTKPIISKPEQEEIPAEEDGGADAYEEEEDEDVEIVLGGTPSAGAGSTSEVKAGPTSKPTIDVTAVGQLNGTSILETDLESFEDRPWRKAGADITDYFNYGFNEQSWKNYCAKQRSMREESTRIGVTGPNPTGPSGAFPMPPLPGMMPPFPPHPMMPPPPSFPFMFRPPPPGALPPRPYPQQSRSPSRSPSNSPPRSKSPSRSRSSRRRSPPKRRRD